MLRWDDERLEVMATADVTVRLDPSHFVPNLRAEDAVVDGRHGGLQSAGESLVIDLLEGETITVAR